MNKAEKQINDIEKVTMKAKEKIQTKAIREKNERPGNK